MTDGKHYVICKIRAAVDQPVTFDSKIFFREGSVSTRVETGSAREAKLWRRLQRSSFEERAAEEDVALQALPERLDIDAYFRLLGMRAPSGLEAAVLPLREQGIVNLQDNGLYTVTNLGALLLGRQMSSFLGLRRRAIRVIRFKGSGNFEIVEDRTFDTGYALAIPQALDFLSAALPAEEVLDGAFRRIVKAYPEIAIRELLSNAVIHQDLTVTDAGPLVRVYDNRIEFSNPGASLVPVGRVLNAQPKTRNTGLVSLLRQMDFCEEGGTGWDYVIASCEAAHMLAPKMTSDDELGTSVTLYKGSGFERMTKAERLDAMYWHACLAYANGSAMNNKSLRERFGLNGDGKHSLAVSRLIRQGCDSGLIKPEDENAGTRYMRYIPAWA